MSLSNRVMGIENHLPPRYTISGHLKVQKVNEEVVNVDKNVKIPNGWKSHRDHFSTASLLYEDRRKHAKPHPSFDINGDGCVSAREFAIAKRFDKNGDDILDDKEKQECIEQLKNGYEDNLYWDPVDASTGCHVVQKNGMIISTTGDYTVNDELAMKMK